MTIRIDWRAAGRATGTTALYWVIAALVLIIGWLPCWFALYQTEKDQPR